MTRFERGGEGVVGQLLKALFARIASQPSKPCDMSAHLGFRTKSSRWSLGVGSGAGSRVVDLLAAGGHRHRRRGRKHRANVSQKQAYRANVEGPSMGGTA